MALDPCSDACTPQLDQVQIAEIYDLINTKVRADLQDDYDCKKINGATFADTWAKMMAPAIGHIMGAAVSILNKETPHDRMLKTAQASLYARQEQGFDDNLRQKLFETQMNSWAMMFSSGLLEYEPQVIKDQEATELYKEILASIGTSSALGYWTQTLAASVPDGGSTTLSWGTVSGATLYTIYASTSEGMVTGFPKIVSAGGNTTCPITAPAGVAVTYTFEIIATNGSESRSSKYSLSYTG